MNQIKNIQVGEEIFSIGSVIENDVNPEVPGDSTPEIIPVASSASRGENLTTISFEDTQVLAGIVRANKICSICPKNGESHVIVMGLPHEIIQESGELWSYSGAYSVIVSHDSTDIPGCPHKATMYQLNDGLAHLLPVDSNGMKISYYCSSRFFEMTTEDTLVLRYCLMDGTVLQEAIVPQDEMPDMVETFTVDFPQSMMSGSHMVMVAANNGEDIFPITYVGDLIEDANADHLYTLIISINGESHTIQFDSTVTGSTLFFDGEITSEEGQLIYVGPSTMTVSPVSHFMLNVNMSDSAEYITNIPIAWADGNPPVFGTDKMVQMSILDGVGAFNTITLDI